MEYIWYYLVWVCISFLCVSDINRDIKMSLAWHETNRIGRIISVLTVIPLFYILFSCFTQFKK